MAYYARSPGASGEPQVLKDHLQHVAALAERFAVEAGLPAGLGRWAGLLHDLGKYSDEFQRHRLQLNADGTPNNEERWRVEHACHGAAIAEAAGDRAVAFSVAGHHGGLPTLADVQKLPKDRMERGTLEPKKLPVHGRAAQFYLRARTDAAFDGRPARVAFPVESDSDGRLAFDLRTRILFSCLVDADRLDAEGHEDALRSFLRRSGPRLDPERRLQAVRAYIKGTAERSGGAENLNAIRQRVLASAIEEATREPGFFSMTVPTGGGKTLSSLAFALAHAARFGQRRIIFVIPYLSIIEQNVDVIRGALGDDALVLEHHSNVIDEADEDEAKGEDGQDRLSWRRRLMAENWDAPVIVTTTVQFFESLFSNRPKKARKLHNIARSVVVFDEAQTFPPGMMRPMMAMLEQLASEPYRTSFLFCTATQPALKLEVGANQGTASPLVSAEVREVAPDPPALYRALKRVYFTWPAGEARTTPEELAEAMAVARQALAIVNTKEQARVLYRALRARNAQAIHLSTRMCAAHRLQVLDTVRERLKAKEPCLVAATQLVEAGVDVDFPTVWRAMGPLDSIAQAAGRCNREGRSKDGPGKVTVFETWDGKLPGGAYEAGTHATKDLLRPGDLDLHDPSVFTRYFKRLYEHQALDKNAVHSARQALDFPEVAERFKIIDSETTPVLVPWGDGNAIVGELMANPAAESVTPSLLRRMQRFTVGLYNGELKQGKDAGLIEEHAGGVRIFRGDYHPALGLVLPGDYSED
jgi:CRISPR-associated endonuclease/helicase Cas3